MRRRLKERPLCSPSAPSPADLPADPVRQVQQSSKAQAVRQKLLPGQKTLHVVASRAQPPPHACCRDHGQQHHNALPSSVLELVDAARSSARCTARRA